MCCSWILNVEELAADFYGLTLMKNIEGGGCVGILDLSWVFKKTAGHYLDQGVWVAYLHLTWFYWREHVNFPFVVHI